MRCSRQTAAAPGAPQQEPLRALHAQYALPLRRFFRSYRVNSPDVEDLIQDVFVRLAKARCPADLQSPEAFVFTLARNLLRDRVRRWHSRAMHDTVASHDVALSCERPTPEQALEMAQRLTRAGEVLTALKPGPREAFMRHRIHGDSYATIASLMDISVSMVEKHIMSAMTALRRIDRP